MLLKTYFKSVKTEFWFTLLFALLLHYFYGTPTQTIAADGIGYYDYLPSTFHYHDVNRHQQNYIPKHPLYERVDVIGKEIYVVNDIYLVNKYPIGTALCIAPFWAVTYVVYSLTHQSVTCYEYPFHLTVWVASLVFVCIALVYLRKLLLTYAISSTVIRWMQVLLLLATPLTRYAHLEASMSHVYSLAVIMATVYYARMFFKTPEVRSFILVCIGLALVVLLRQVNGLVLLFLPFIAGSWLTLSESVMWLLKRVGVLFAGLLIALILVGIQPLFWWLQTGKWVIYSYSNERFYFNDPHFFSILFGFKKGLFIYTPVLLLVFAGLYYYLKTKQWYLFFAWVIPFVTINYILSSWWSWFYGCSFGLRAYIDYFPFFLLLIATALTFLTYRFWLVLFGLMCIPLNLVQTYQYKNYILHWINMDWDSYKKVFLKTGVHYGGALWKPEFYAEDFDTLAVFSFGNRRLNAENHYVLKIPADSLPGLYSADQFQLSFVNTFDEDNPADLVFVIADSTGQQIDFYANRRLLHFYNQSFNQWQRGWYNFGLTVQPQNGRYLIINYEQSGTETDLVDVKLMLFKKKKLP